MPMRLFPGSSSASMTQVLALIDKIDVLDVDKVANYVATLQNEDGSFNGDKWGEVDTRFSYIAICCLSLLHRLDKINVEKAVNYIVSCKSHDGGFGCTSAGESHAGQIFCCVGALAITGSLHHIDKDLLGWWLCERQVNSGDILIKAKVKPGGLNGRPEKLPDSMPRWSFRVSNLQGSAYEWDTKANQLCLSLLEYPGVKAIDSAYALPVDVVNRIMLGR